MKRGVLLILLAAAAPRLFAQWCVDPQVTTGTTSGPSIIINNVNFPDDSALQTAANDWNSSSCGNYGTAFPSIDFGSQAQGNSRFINLYYDSGIGPGVCGEFNGSSITLFGRAILDNDLAQIVSCGPVMTENIEHEIGHALGLGDSGCNGYIMNTIHVDAYGNYNSRSIQPDECSAVDQEYKTSDELLRDLDWCNLSCPTGCSGVPPICHPPPPTYDTGCPDCGSRGYSPIIINLGAGEYKLSGTDDPVTFDINADGVPDAVSWTARRSRMAFLVMDRNHNQTIDDGSELFGDSTRLIDGTRASNGFEALRQLDSDGDGVIDSRDRDWPNLALWIDTNHDGVSQPEELMTLESVGITALKFAYHWTGRHDRSGNIFRWEAQYETGNQVHAYYDIYFVVKR